MTSSCDYEDYDKSKKALLIAMDNVRCDPIARLLSQQLSTLFLQSVPISTNEIPKFIFNVHDQQKYKSHFTEYILFMIIKTQQDTCTKLQNQMDATLDAKIIAAKNLDPKYIDDEVDEPPITKTTTLEFYFNDKTKNHVKIVIESIYCVSKLYITFYNGEHNINLLNERYSIDNLGFYVFIHDVQTYAQIMQNIKKEYRDIFKVYTLYLYNNKDATNKTYLRFNSDIPEVISTLNKMQNSSTFGLTESLAMVLEGKIGGGKNKIKTPKYKKTSQLTTYKNKNYNIYMGIKGGHYIRLKTNNNIEYKYIQSQ